MAVPLPLLPPCRIDAFCRYNMTQQCSTSEKYDGLFEVPGESAMVANHGARPLMQGQRTGNSCVCCQGTAADVLLQFALTAAHFPTPWFVLQCGS